MHMLHTSFPYFQTSITRHTLQAYSMPTFSPASWPAGASNSRSALTPGAIAHAAAPNLLHFRSQESACAGGRQCAPHQ